MVLDRTPRTLGELCLRQAAQYPDRLAVTDGANRLTYGELGRSACRVAGAFAELGVVPGDRVVLRGRNRVPWVVAAFGALLAGAVVAPVGHAAADRGELAGGPPRLVVGDPAGAGEVDLDDLVGAARGRTSTLPPLGGERTAVVMRTSGTTGTPKAVPLGHGQLLRAYSDLARRLEITHRDRLLGAVPLAHSFGFSGVLLVAVLAGASVRLVPNYDRDRIADLVVAEGITTAMGPPTVLFDLLAGGGGEVGSVCGLAVTGGAEVPLPRITAACEAMGIRRCWVGYGLTEASGAVAVGDASDAVGGVPALTPLDGVEVCVVDRAGRALAPGAEGQVLVRGHNVMRGYEGDAEATAEVLTACGWLRTGDLGRLGADGRLAIVSRCKDVVIVSGFNVHPHEVEEVLRSHRSVADAVVLGVVDARQGERLVACVVLREGHRPDPAVLREHCRQRLAAYEVPGAVLWFDSLPARHHGKIARSAVREFVAERVDLLP